MLDEGAAARAVPLADSSGKSSGKSAGSLPGLFHLVSVASGLSLNCALGVGHVHSASGRERILCPALASTEEERL